MSRRRARMRGADRAAAVVALAYLAVALLGPALCGSAGLRLALPLDLAPPGRAGAGLLGNADNGVDVLTALVWGARTSLMAAGAATLVNVGVGLVVGALAASLAPRAQALVLRVLDVLLAFPGILLAIYLAAVLPPSMPSLILALSATGWAGTARVVRTRALEIRARDHVEAARALGATPLAVLTRHVLPFVWAPLLVQGSFALSAAILAEASLAFLGLGLPPGTPSWGGLLDEGVAYLFVAPHLAIAPGLCITAAVLAFHVLGDGLRDALDVRLARVAR
ncbi:MAG: ABC transporter permease [Deltaproteobacteria bacterium]|nr:ABC transporter permease [Deltaproteobacteria bacterium]